VLWGTTPILVAKIVANDNNCIIVAKNGQLEQFYD
jgi:hypothetical protein